MADQDEPPPERPLEELVESMYAELRRIAQLHLRRSPAGEVDPTDIVHECYVRLARSEGLGQLGRTDFLALAASVIRNVLVDLARERNAVKRGRGWRRISLHAELRAGKEEDVDLIDLDAALRKLALLDLRHARIVELRFFAGLSEAETAEVLAISRRSVGAEWALARAWLMRELGR